MSDSKFILVAGLGNPGKEYSQTRHNIGFMVLDELAARANQRMSKSRFDADFARCRINGRNLFLAKPMAYMNRSGPPIQRLSAYYKIDMRDIIVVHDDMDLAFGKLKIVQGRGHGGHNGMRSIIDAFGRKECIRVRVGVGHPGGSRDVTGHVLGRFTLEEQGQLDALIDDAADVCQGIASQGLVKIMNQVNARR
jgi:PTH1 family peptidyl-tRNA hydrolase